LGLLRSSLRPLANSHNPEPILITTAFSGANPTIAEIMAGFEGLRFIREMLKERLKK
jgi:hypothetical protein